MSYVPVLWNRGYNPMQHDFDDMFHMMDPWAFGGPMAMRPGRRRRQHETSLADRKWTFGVKIGDFDSEHVKVKVENGKVVIHAKYTEGNDEWGDTVERRRTVQVPENVETENIHSFMRSDGTLMLEAPYRMARERQLAVVPQESGALVPSDSHNNLMKFSVGNFNPDEVKISCKDGVLTAQGERQKSEDGHEVRESFFRQMTVPTTVDVNDIQCFRDGDGNLTIRAPMIEDVDMKQPKK